MKHAGSPSVHGKRLCKNIALTLCIALFPCLCAANWLFMLSPSSTLSIHTLQQRFGQVKQDNGGYLVHSSGAAATLPVQIALQTAQGQLRAVQYEGVQMQAALEAVHTLWNQALRGVQPVEVEEAALVAALQEDQLALLRYHSALPLCLLADWFDGTSSSTLEVQTLLYSQTQERVFFRDRSGALYAAPASVSPDARAAAQQDFSGQPCRFVGPESKATAETLLFEDEQLRLPALTRTRVALFGTQGGTKLEALLAAFDYTPYARSYTEQAGQVRVFVNEGATLRVSETEPIRYTASGETDTVRAYYTADANEAMILSAQLDCARSILDAVLRASDTGTQAMLTGVVQQDARTLFYFGRAYNGIPLLEAQDAAVFAFEGAQLRTAIIALACDRPGEQTHAVLPAAQAVATATGERCTLDVVYQAAPDHGDTLLPTRVWLDLALDTDAS